MIEVLIKLGGKVQCNMIRLLRSAKRTPPTGIAKGLSISSEEKTDTGAQTTSETLQGRLQRSRLGEK